MSEVIMDLRKKIQHFISYWYLRYLLVTELYMVETWEKIVIHVVLTIIFSLFWYFNYLVILNGVSQLRSPHMEQIL